LHDKNLPTFFLTFFAFLLGIRFQPMCARFPPHSADKSIPQHGLLLLFISGIPITSRSLTVSSNCGRLAKSPLMINHTTAGDKRQKRVATMERAEHATTNHQWERQRLVAAGYESKRTSLAIGNERGQLPSCDDVRQ
jgi:hypothetical protein